MPDKNKKTLWYRFKEWFVNNINWCEGYYYGTDTPKPENRVLNWFYRHWLWPWKQNDCMCCNTVRGVIYGFIVGFVAALILS